MNGAGLAEATATVRAFRPVDGDQAAARDAILAFCATHPDALHRSCRDGHVTSSALVVDAGADRALVLFHAKLRRWLQPGGHVDGDGDLARSALREAREETGIDGLRVGPVVDVDVHTVAPPGEEPHLHHDVRFLVTAPAGAVAAGNHESEALAWWGVDRLDRPDVDPSLRRLARVGFRVARTGRP